MTNNLDYLGDGERQVLMALEQEIRRQAQAGCERLDMDMWMTHSVWGRRHTERRFRDIYLTSPARYFRDCQAEIAGELLARGDDVLSASVKSGFASPGRLHDAVVTRYGMTPGEVRQKGEGVMIYYGFFTVQVGLALIGATQRGLSWLSLCGASVSEEEAIAQINQLKATYPQARFEEDTEPIQVYADQLVAYLEKRTPAFCPPLDILQGTTFQREVWAALQKTKPGEQLTYSEIAERIGKPKAVRAVANACGSNNVAIAIPCHRAIRKDGTLSGYRWGVDWKKRLLSLEAQRQKSIVVEN